MTAQNKNNYYNTSINRHKSNEHKCKNTFTIIIYIQEVPSLFYMWCESKQQDHLVQVCKL